ncbi:MAG: MFS transporter [Thermotogae bacterium]|nr:MFS transporter [Thermotogota bacterium]
MNLPWKQPKKALAISAYLGFMEFLRSGFFVGFLPIYGIDVLKVHLTYIGLTTTTHYLIESLIKMPATWLLVRVKLGNILVGASLLVLLSLVGFLYLPIYAFPLLSATWALAMTTLWPKLASFLTKIAKEDHKGRAVTYSWIIIAPIIGLGGFSVGLIAKENIPLSRNLLLAVAILALGIALLLRNLDFPEKTHEKRTAFFRAFIKTASNIKYLLLPAFIQNLVPHLLTNTLFPYIKTLSLSNVELVVYIATGAILFFLIFNIGSKYSDTRDPFDVLIASVFLALIGFALFAQPVSKATIIFGVLAISFAMGLLIPGWNALIVKTLPSTDKGEGWSAISTVSSIAIAAGPLIGAVAWDILGPNGPFTLGTLLLAILLGYYLLLKVKMGI